MSAGPAAVNPDVQPVLNETRDRIITGIVTVVPFLALGVAAGRCGGRCCTGTTSWSSRSSTSLTGLGVTVGFHRLFTHRAFATSRRCAAVFAVLGSAAIEGPVISWVADHRKHHAFSDREGDPHSPHVDHGGAGAVR